MRIVRRLQQEIREAAAQGLKIASFTFPYNQHFPTQVLKRFEIDPVSVGIPGKLRIPIIRSSLRHARRATPIVQVPEASINLNDFVADRKDEIRRVRKVTAMKPKPSAQRMNNPAHHHLRSGVLAANPTHECASLLRRQIVSHRGNLSKTRNRSGGDQYALRHCQSKQVALGRMNLQPYRA